MGENILYQAHFLAPKRIYLAFILYKIARIHVLEPICDSLPFILAEEFHSNTKHNRKQKSLEGLH